MLNYDNDISDKLSTNDSINDINMNGLAAKYSNSVMLQSYSNVTSDNYVKQDSCDSVGNVNIYKRYGKKYDNYDLDGCEHYPHQEVQLADGGQVKGTLGCNDILHRPTGLGFEYDPQFLPYNEQLNNLIEFGKSVDQLGYLSPDSNDMKPVYVYNDRLEISYTMIIDNQTCVDTMENANNNDTDMGMGNIHGQFLHIFDQEALMESQCFKIAYIQSMLEPEISGFYVCMVDEYGYLHRLLQYTGPWLGLLKVNYTFNISISKVRARTGGSSDHISSNPTLAYDNYCKDIQTFDHYKCSYEKHITDIIDKLMLAADLDLGKEINQSTQELIYEKSSQGDILPIVDNDTSNIVRACDERSMNNEKVENLITDFNYPDKKFGYLTQAATDFSFIGPDREPVEISSIDTLLKVADCILSTGVPNYRAARIPIKSGLNVEAWERHLQDYSDKRVIQYIKFGYPLSLINPHELCNKEVSNHYSACQFPSQVQEYINKEKKLGALLGPIQDISHNQFHCSPLLTRPKDGDNRRVILNLSYPACQSVNDHVDKNEFDHTPFILKFPTIDSIARGICEAGDDVVLFKVDVARAFRNLRVDPANALKFGIKWADAFYVNFAVAFGWTHGSGAFQILSDAIAFIMAKKGVKLHCYIDDYIVVSSKHKASTEFTLLCDLLDELGLPINASKLTPPTKQLTCLGIDINIDTNTMSIAEDKLEAIYAECIAVSNKNSLSKQAYQSLLGKLIYIQKCVKPSRTFINRILDLFRKNSHQKRSS